MRSLLRLSMFVCVLSPALAHAAGGIGSVVVESVTSTTMRISWTFDAAEYVVEGTPPYMICYKTAGDPEGACNGGTVKFASVNFRDLDGLTANTLYKIKVIGRDVRRVRKLGLSGAFDRKIATLTAATTHESSPTPVFDGTVWIASSGTNSFELAWNIQYPGNFSDLFLAYRRQFALGGFTFTPTFSSTFTTAPITGLSRCRSYVIFLSGHDSTASHTARPIGVVKGHTRCSGLCIIEEKVVDDFEDTIYRDYVTAIDSLYGCGFGNRALQCSGLFNNLAARYPQLASARTDLLENGDDDIAATVVLIEYLVVADSAIYHAWQSDPSLVAAGLDLRTFTDKKFPGVWNMLQDECSDPAEAIPTLSQWGSGALALLLTGTALWMLKTRRERRRL